MRGTSILLLILLAGFRPLPASDLVLKEVPAQVYFSPDGGAEAAVVAALGRARQTVLVQAYSFTDEPIAQALKAAHDRGVAVRAILDKSQLTERHSDLAFLVQAGVPTWIDAVHAIAHNKVMVIDGRWVVTGSFNFTRAAEHRNAENLLILDAPELAARYARNWEAHLAHSGPVR